MNIAIATSWSSQHTLGRFGSASYFEREWISAQSSSRSMASVNHARSISSGVRRRLQDPRPEPCWPKSPKPQRCHPWIKAARRGISMDQKWSESLWPDRLSIGHNGINYITCNALVRMQDYNISYSISHFCLFLLRKAWPSKGSPKCHWHCHYCHLLYLL